jgi:hypothetical protein
MSNRDAMPMRTSLELSQCITLARTAAKPACRLTHLKLLERDNLEA